MNRLQGNSHMFHGLSMQIFKPSDNEMALLFRDECDNLDSNDYEHPQPHWHFHPQIEYLINESYLNQESFDTYLSLVSESDFEKELSQESDRKSSDISSFHFAMSSRWQNKESAIIPLN